MKFIQLIFFLFYCNCLLAQDQSKEFIIAEGTQLYRSELTSWNADDFISENYAEKIDLIGGSFSYAEPNGMKCVFFSKASNPIVIATVTFDSTLDIKSGRIDKNERAFTKMETSLYIIRLNTIIAIASDNIFFKRYINTSQVIVPLIEGDSKKVYIMTGVKKSCMVIFGNDYLISFDENNKIIEKKYLHKNIIPVECAKDITLDNHLVPGTMHLHNAESGNLPTSTDICNLLLYSKQANWKQHTIFAPDSVSIWNCDARQLKVVSKDTWRSIYGVKK